MAPRCFKRPLAILLLVAFGGRPSSGWTDEMVDLFHYGDLRGWVVEGTKNFEEGGETVPVWTAHDGVVRCSGNGSGFLRYDEELIDFSLSLEYRMTKKCNSGIGIRGLKFDGSVKTRPSFAGYELQILDDEGKPATNRSSMSLYRYVAPQENSVRPAGAWNTLAITCAGPKIRVLLNGVTMHDFDQTQIDSIRNKPLRGYFSLQNHGKPIDFRRVRLKKLALRESRS